MYNYLQELLDEKYSILKDKDLYLDKMLSGKLTEEDAFNFKDKLVNSYELRRYFTKNSWYLITVEYLQTLRLLTKGLSVLEVCAGGGHTSRLMNENGCKWIATDMNVGEGNHYGTIWNSNVVKMEALEAIVYFQPNVIFVSWIPCESDLDISIASMEVPVIMVGEGRGGCTGSDEFWKKYEGKVVSLDEYDPSLNDVVRWFGMCDRTWIIYPDKLRSW